MVKVPKISEGQKGKKRNLKKLMLNDLSFGKFKATSTPRLSDHLGINAEQLRICYI